jgi:transposase
VTWAVADTEFDGNEIRDLLAERRIETVIPSNPGRTRVIPYNKRTSRRRNRIEQLVNKLKQSWRVATQYERLATTFQVFIYLVAAFISIR